MIKFKFTRKTWLIAITVGIDGKAPKWIKNESLKKPQWFFSIIFHTILFKENWDDFYGMSWNFFSFNPMDLNYLFITSILVFKGTWNRKNILENFSSCWVTSYIYTKQALLNYGLSSSLRWCVSTSRKSGRDKAGCDFDKHILWIFEILCIFLKER